jgi:hypothetical protein
MKSTKWLILAAIALPLSVGITGCASSPSQAAAPQVSCADIKFGEAFLARYPKAPAACLEARDDNGARYAKFEGKIYISDPEFMTVQLLNAAGDTVTTFSFKPGPDQGVTVDGQKKKFHNMAVGEKLTFWVSETRMTAQELPTSTAESWSVLPPR